MSTDKVKKKKKINSRAKGALGESSLANLLRDKYGYKDAKRGQQFSGGKDSPDVVCPNFPYHIECKRVQRLKVHDALAQSTRDAEGGGKVPIVVHRENNEEWVVSLSLPEFMDMVRRLMIDEL